MPETSLRSPEIRERFLRFFAERGHTVLESSSLIPHDDPSLLFTVAGMVPLKPYISGLRTPPSPRLVSCQKCFRGAGLKYDDIAEVGDSWHHTFFEMLGNWSIGDYFKEGAIALAWEWLTGELGLDPDRLWPSIYPDDTEAERVWVEQFHVPRERVARFTDNWWAAGPTGPCGYDSEIFWDFGAPCSCGSTSCRPQEECGGDRWVEIWNLVFMEFDQHEDGSRDLLPKPTVDTGMSLERMTGVVQGHRNAYTTDLFVSIIDGFRSRARSAPETPARTRSFNVLADHLRGAGFLIAAGVVPSNEGRGYVLRRVIRRAAVHGRRLGLEGGLAAGSGDLVAIMGGVYPELVESRVLIETTLRTEEDGFTRTLTAGEERLAAVVGDGGHVSGADAFRLYDTFGLPVELTVEMAGERGAIVDLEGFREAMAEQRARSQAATVRVGFDTGVDIPATRFVGYETLDTDAVVTRIGLATPRAALTAGEQAEVLLDPSPFYATAGGQIGDTGALTWVGGRATVNATDPIAGSDARVHTVMVDDGELAEGTQVHAAVDAARRGRTARHHSATHLLNRALRDVLGGDIVQRGSFVGPDHATFDFSFPRALTAGETAAIEHLVNDAIRRNLERSATVMALAAARAGGAIALLDEAYSADVRVIDFGGWSRELCGGTHVSRSGDLGAVLIVAESSIGQGIRRIELVAGEAAEERWQRAAAALQTAARALKVPADDVPERVAALQEQVRKLRAAPQGGVAMPPAATTDTRVAGITVARIDLDGEAADVSASADRAFADHLNGDGIAVVLGTSAMAVKLGGRAASAGLDAGALVRVAAAATGGSGGGRADYARGSVKEPGLRDAAYAAVLDSIRHSLGGA